MQGAPTAWRAAAPRDAPVLPAVVLHVPVRQVQGTREETQGQPQHGPCFTHRDVEWKEIHL